MEGRCCPAGCQETVINVPAGNPEAAPPEVFRILARNE
jgi:hypothetical protein